MAVIANLEGIGPVDAIYTKIAGPPLPNRFPVPGFSWGFITDIFVINAAALDNPIAYDALGPPYIIFGALNPESDFLEPTRGQIWPRIG